MEVLSEIIECSVCLERMDTKSKVLPCQHTFCSDCLHRIYIQNKNELKCPECRYICNVPVRNLPSNILLIRLLEGLKAAGNTVASKREALRDAGKPCAEAMYSYEPQEQGDLRFRRGDLIYLKKRLDDNWYVGELNGKSGYLPATYVKVICSFPSAQSKPTVTPNSNSTANNQSEPTQHVKVTVKALYDFEMKDEEKEDCLKFRKDEVIQLIRRVDHNWAEGRLVGTIGIFPINYVKLTEPAKALLDTSTQSRAISSSTPGRSAQNVRTRNVSGPAALYHSTSAPCSTCFERTEVSQQVDHSGRLSSGCGAVASTVPGANTYIPVPGASPQHVQSVSSSAPTDSSLRSSLSPKAADTESSPTKSRLSEEEPLPVPARISVHDIYRAMYNYKPQKEDELKLVRGCLYHVTDRCKDGWYRGRCLKAGSSGVFPGNYVQLIPPDSDGASGDALRTMRRGRLEPPSEKPSEKTAPVGSDSGVGSKMRNPVKRNASARERRRSSSLSRLENQSAVIRSRDQAVKSMRGRSTKPAEPVKSGKPTRMRYICVMAYPAQDDLELDLKVGDVVVVLKKKGEGWYKGTNETSGKTGVFPACFVQSFTASSGNDSRSS